MKLSFLVLKMDEKTKNDDDHTNINRWQYKNYFLK